MIRSLMRRRNEKHSVRLDLHVLEEHADRIDPLMVLELLPGDVLSHELLQYYQQIIPHSMDTLREARIQLGMTQ